MLGPLGFGPEETFADFHAMGSNPEPITGLAAPEPDLGTELDQKAYYELVMGRQFTYP